MKVDNINISFGDQIVIENSSITISQGNRYLLLGPNGIGKSSLLDSIVKSCIGKYSISYATQATILLENLSINENIKFMKIRDIEEHLTFMLPNIDRNKKVKYLSGGQKQKLKLLLVLSVDAQIYVLDEPFNNLDKASCKYITKYFLEDTTKTIVMVLHNTNEFFDYNTVKIIDRKIVQNTVDYTELNTIDKDKNKTNEFLFFKNKFRNNLFKELLVIVLLIITTILISSHLVFDDSYNMFNSDDVYYCESDCQSGTNILSLSESSIPYKTSDEMLLEFQVNKLDFSNYPSEELYDQTMKITIGNSGLVKVYPATMLHPYELMNEINYMETIYPFNELLYGSFPKDNSKEIIIDEILAVYIMNEQDLVGIEEVIGKSITIDNTTYIVSGIYKNNETDSYVFTSYNEEKISSAYKTSTYSFEQIDGAINNPDDKLRNFIAYNYVSIIFVVGAIICVVIILFIHHMLFYYINSDSLKVLKIYQFYKPLQRYSAIVYTIIAVIILVVCTLSK